MFFAPTSLTTPSTVVGTLLSKTDGQLTPAQTLDLTNLLTEFYDVFSDVPSRTTLGEHHIELMPDIVSVRCTPYRLSPGRAKILKDELSNLLRQGIIEDITSPWASLVVVVLKADGSLHLCTDFR